MSAAAPRSSPGSPTVQVAAFDAGGLHYSVEDRGGQIVHKEECRDADGRVLAAREADVAFELGSGIRGKSFLIKQGDFLVQSPIAWYAQKQRWDLSPGYESNNAHFERAIPGECLFCHTNRVDPDENVVGRFRSPLFPQGLAIGCERCHGPGALHVRGQDVREGRDLTVVNPRHLRSALRDGVCEQCHLKGEISVERAGRHDFDYRPGLALEEFITVFVRPVNKTGGIRSVGHVEQMHASRCYGESRGELGCISCHDPHHEPSVETKAGYYRERCLECHAEHGCALPEERRVKGGRDDQCVACHMPRTDTADVAHTAGTAHQIVRFPVDAVAPPDDGMPPVGRPGELLVRFHNDRLGPREDGGAARDMGIALSLLGQGNSGRTVSTKMASRALELVEVAAGEASADVPALEAKARALALLGRNEEAMPVLERVLGLAPGRERSLVLAAHVATKLGRREAAIAFWKRALTVNPWSSEYHYAAAKLLAQGQQAQPAAELLRSALSLNPAHLQARKLLVELRLQANDREGASREFSTLLRFGPPNRDGLRRWFSEQSSAR